VKLEKVGEIIAERKLKLVRDGFDGETVVVALGRPQLIRDHSDFYGCPYQIKRSDSQKLMTICGIDAFQALPLAINAIGVELEVIRRDSGGQLI
jgi:hypothetical protein